MGHQRTHMALKSLLQLAHDAKHLFCFVLLAAGGLLAARAEIRFDVFLGYDGTAREAAWFPITCEIANDGPGFTGFIELSPTSFGKGQTQRLPIELPTGTLKRVVIPAFAPSRYPTSFDVQLADGRGKVRAEALGVRPQRQVGWETKLMGALPRTAAGMVSLHPIKRNQPDAQPAAVRFQPTMFPDNPLVLEAMDALYLNSELAVSLRTSQVNALRAWLNAGGHLIVAIEQVNDVTGVPWLRNLLPCEPQEIVPVSRHGELDQWLVAATTVTNFYPPSPSKLNQRRPPALQAESAIPGRAFGEKQADQVLEAAEIRVVTGSIKDGRAVVTVAGKPLIITANRGLGRVTVLMFSPEREPFKSWADLPTLWTLLLEVPLELYSSTDFNSGYGNSVDGLFGAMIDSRQVHKLPVTWLLVLLVVYLIVIGPFDRIWLKKINRPMLTWITFPCYVLLFSGLIYFIGYRLRAGDSEYSELHVVDVLANGARAEMRGRTYASIYSPSNAKYPLQSSLKSATLRGEYLGSRGGETSDKATLWHTGDNFKAEVLVPVWTSQLFLSDWWESGDQPLLGVLKKISGGWELAVENRSSKPVTAARLAFAKLIYELGEIPAGAGRTWALQDCPATPVADFVNGPVAEYANIAQQRQFAFGRSGSGRIEDLATASMVASFLGELPIVRNGLNLVAAPGLDLSGAVRRGDAVLLAWSPAQAPVAPLLQSKTKRTTTNTLWRIPISVPTQN